MDEVEDWSKRREDMLRRMIFHNSLATLIFDFKNWFQVTTYPIHKSSVYVKYEQYWAKGRED